MVNKMGGLGRKRCGLKVGNALWVMAVILVMECMGLEKKGI